MATKTDSSRLALNLEAGLPRVAGAWWPRSRVLNDELPHLFAMWPTEAGHITRILYSPPDWDDRPRVVVIPGRAGRVKTGSFPRDDNHQVVLVMLDGRRLSFEVISPETPPAVAARLLRDLGRDTTGAGAAVRTST